MYQIFITFNFRVIIAYTNKTHLTHLWPVNCVKNYIYWSEKKFPGKILKSPRKNLIAQINQTNSNLT